MKINQESWIKQYRASAETLAKKGCKPASSEVCIHATLNWICANWETGKEPREQFKELFTSIVENGSWGFASNASAASAKAGFKAANSPLADALSLDD